LQQDLQESRRRAGRIEELIQEVSTFSDPQARATTEELLQALMDMYGEGLARILELTDQSTATGSALIEEFARDDLVSSLFLLHDLHPIAIETRITRALSEVRPYLKSHGGNVEFIKVEDGIAYLRLEGSCQGCSASTATLKQTIEEAVYNAAPDLNGLQVEGVADPPRHVAPVTFVPRKRKDGASAQPTAQNSVVR
jgi:Fe-S cluster biogenesis protein NfuA